MSESVSFIIPHILQLLNLSFRGKEKKGIRVHSLGSHIITQSQQWNLHFVLFHVSGKDRIFQQLLSLCFFWIKLLRSFGLIQLCLDGGCHFTGGACGLRRRSATDWRQWWSLGKCFRRSWWLWWDRSRYQSIFLASCLLACGYRSSWRCSSRHFWILPYCHQRILG